METFVMYDKKDVEVVKCEPLYQGFFRCNKYTLRHKLFSGEWSGHIFGWELKPCFNSSTLAQSSEGGPSRKKKKGSGGLAEDAHVKSISPAFTIRAHAQAASGLQIAYSFNRLYTCSHDHTIKIWDLERQDCVRCLAECVFFFTNLHFSVMSLIFSLNLKTQHYSTFPCLKVATSMHWSSVNSLVASSHADGRVRIWDSRRSGEDDVSVGSYGSSQVSSSRSSFSFSFKSFLVSLIYPSMNTGKSINISLSLSNGSPRLDGLLVRSTFYPP